MVDVLQILRMITNRGIRNERLGTLAGTVRRKFWAKTQEVLGKDAGAHSVATT
jgi:hypothetical protein